VICPYPYRIPFYIASPVSLREKKDVSVKYFNQEAKKWQRKIR